VSTLSQTAAGGRSRFRVVRRDCSGAMREKKEVDMT
jgi:hypothetical protein